MINTKTSSRRHATQTFRSAVVGLGLGAAALVIAGCGTDRSQSSAPIGDESSSGSPTSNATPTPTSAPTTDAFLGLDCRTIGQWVGLPDGYEPTRTDDAAGDLPCEWVSSTGSGELSVSVGWDALTLEQQRSTVEEQGLPFVTSTQIEGLGGFVYSLMDDPRRDLDVRLPFHQGNLIYLTLAQREGPVDLLAAAERVAAEVVNR